MVVQAVPARVMARVVQPHVSKRDVADRHIEVPVRQAGGGKRLGANVLASGAFSSIPHPVEVLASPAPVAPVVVEAK